MSEIRCPLNETAHISINQPALIGPHGVLLYSEVEQCVCASAQLLRKAGFKPGQRAVLSMRADWRFVVLFMAMAREGILVWPVSPRTNVSRLAETMARLGFQDVFATARRAATLTKAGVRAHVIKDFTGFTAPMNPRFKPVIPLDQPVSLFSGSGRGRMPMPLVHDMGAHYYSARGGNAVIRTTDRDRWLSLFPVYEHGGLHALFRCMVSGAALVLPGAREALPDAADKYEVTHLILSPRQLQRWCAQGKDAMKIKTLRKVIVLARRTPIQALENLRQLGLQAHAGYAVPEAAGPVTLETNAGARQPQDTSGVAHPYCRVHLDAKGGIYLKGPTLMAGHWQQSRFMPLSDGDAWHPTGDKGRIDAAGRLIVQ